jgi:hypothetical protein
MRGMVYIMVSSEMPQHYVDAWKLNPRPYSVETHDYIILFFQMEHTYSMVQDVI